MEKAIAPVQPSTFIGPPANCHRAAEEDMQQYPQYINHHGNQMYTAPAYNYQYQPNPRIIIIENKFR